MSVQPLQEHGQKLPCPQGHAIGFVDSVIECDAVVAALNAAGIPDEKIMIFTGEDGVHLLERMMKGFTWGEEAESFIHRGQTELHHGHSAVVVEVTGRIEASRVAMIAGEHGGHSFDHFGLFVDTRLTK